MTQPMTPREKVARMVSPKCWEFYDRHAADPRMKAEINHEVAPSLQLTDAILTALVSGSGDHAELARKLRARAESIVETPLGPFRSSKGRLRNPDGPSAADALEALIAEIAALRGERDRNWEEYLAERQSRMEHGSREAGYLDQIGRLNSRATEAERKLAEARGWIKKLDCECDPAWSTRQCGRCTFLSSTEAERG